MQRMYASLKAILANNNIAGFNVLYASTIVLSERGALHNFVNFAGIAANRKFIWRKYDIGGGSGQNWVYVDGEKMNTSTFLRIQKSDPAKFAALIAKLK